MINEKIITINNIINSYANNLINFMKVSYKIILMRER